MNLQHTFVSIFNWGTISENLSIVNDYNFHRGLYKQQLIIPVGRTMEIPTFLNNNLEELVGTIFRGKTLKPDEIRVLLIPHSYTPTKRSADSIFMFLINSGGNRLRAVKTTSGKVYYGNRSLILNERFQLLYMCGSSFSVDFISNTYQFNESFIYVDPLVFQDQNDLMNKAIIKKFIPAMTENGYYRFVIKDLSEYIHRDVLPLSNNDPEELQKLLEDNLTNILDAVA